MSDWQPIEKRPDRDMAVLLYFGNLKWKKVNGDIAPEFPKWRQERVEVGFYHDGTWCENGTGHDVFEEWRLPDYTPTHWQPLPEPPEDKTDD